MLPHLPGWLWNGERLVTDDTVEGALARRMTVSGTCRLHAECTRRVTLDLHYLADHGFSCTPLDEVRRRYDHLRSPRCEMAWITTYPASIPLQCFLRDNAWLVVTCKGCNAAQAFTFARMIRALERSGRGNGNTSVLKVAEVLREPCRTRQRAYWSVEIQREPASGTGALPSRKALRPTLGSGE